MEQNTNIRNLELTNIALTEVPISENSNPLDSITEKVRDIEIPQLKVYMGIGYSVVMVVLTFLLLL